MDINLWLFISVIFLAFLVVAAMVFPNQKGFK